LRQPFVLQLRSLAEETVATNLSEQVDPDTGIPDLIRRLADDSKRLAGDEVRLAKLELHESVHTGIDGSVRLAVAVAFGVVAAVALTVLLVAAVAAMVGHNYWAGALIVGVLELVVGVFALRRGLRVVKSPSYSLQASRESLKDTAAWVRHAARR
jgi:uncharacterized membrane protein YqjE